MLFENFFPKFHQYYVFATGVKCVSETFETRREAEIYMWKICSKNNISGLECTEYDKHERKYSNHNGVKFYINRI